MPRYTVVCGNVGTVYDGFSLEAASTVFVNYRTASLQRAGRVAGESVTLFKADPNGESIVEEHRGPVDDDNDDEEEDEE